MTGSVKESYHNVKISERLRQNRPELRQFGRRYYRSQVVSRTLAEGGLTEALSVLIFYLAKLHLNQRHSNFKN